MGKQVQPGEMNAVTDYSALIDGAGIMSVNFYWMMS